MSKAKMKRKLSAKEISYSNISIPLQMIDIIHLQIKILIIGILNYQCMNILG